MTRVGIIGASGYTGAELLRVLCAHPGVRITLITSRQYEGKPLYDCYPGLSPLPFVFENHEDEKVLEKADFYFTALPHEASAEVVAKLLALGKRVVDLSADFRFSDPEEYEAHYGPHPHPELCREAVYGLSEIYGEKVKSARLVANPGCYPTSSLLPLLPLIQEGMIDPDSIIIDAKSGVSGAGRGANQTTHFCEANESLKAYKVASHRHTPEIESHLSAAAKKPVKVVFTPHLIPMTRGMLATIYATPLRGVKRADVENIWKKFYEKTPFVEVAPKDILPDTAFVRGTNRCMMGVRDYPSCNRLVILSVIDNLAKGASTQAIQNMNLMLGYGMAEGLSLQTLVP
ncbi:N-acetyl-gamma-glutamyl-phosphate reductase [bacterium]|nr:MAG: N-acetyl-gamma-glutamyl-phosphate reductase [bacterium]